MCSWKSKINNFKSSHKAQKNRLILYRYFISTRFSFLKYLNNQQLFLHKQRPYSSLFPDVLSELRKDAVLRGKVQIIRNIYLGPRFLGCTYLLVNSKNKKNLFNKANIKNFQIKPWRIQYLLLHFSLAKM